MSEEPKPEPKRTWTAREIVLEIFPATDDRWIPRPRSYGLERTDDGALLVRDRRGDVRARWTPVAPAGEPSARLCCDLCSTQGSREDLQMMRAEVPGSDGRRWRYLAACRDTRGCEARRLDDDVIEAMLRPD